MAKPVTSDLPKDKTPDKWKTPKDAREGDADNTARIVRKTRSGHIIETSDTKDGEHITIQHRGGSMFQFLPDGAIHIVAHNGQYNIVMGENRMMITGAYDITVKGGGSLKVDGDYNMTVRGDYNVTTEKDYNVTAKNLNQNIRGNMDTQAKNQTTKVEGNIATTAQGAIGIAAKYGATLESTGDSVGIRGAKQVGIEAVGGEMMIKAGGKTSIKSKGDVALESTDGGVGMKGKGDVALESEQNVGLKSGSDVVLKPGGNIHLDGPDAPTPTAPDDPKDKFEQQPAPETSTEAPATS